MFENRDDADRYAGLLEAQDFPTPTVEALDREEIELFCREAGYEARFVSDGFVPKTDDERMMLAPPSANRDVTNWQEQEPQQDQSQVQGGASKDGESAVQDLDDVRRRLEGLL